jgi:hypothetical protein
MATTNATTATATDTSDIVVAKNGERVHLRISITTADEAVYLHVDGTAVAGSGILLEYGNEPYVLDVTGDYDDWKTRAVEAIRAGTSNVDLAIFEVSR